LHFGAQRTNPAEFHTRAVTADDMTTNRRNKTDGRVDMILIKIPNTSQFN
jgi:hypothetical protein